MKRKADAETEARPRHFLPREPHWGRCAICWGLNLLVWASVCSQVCFSGFFGEHVWMQLDDLLFNVVRWLVYIYILIFIVSWRRGTFQRWARVELLNYDVFWRCYWSDLPRMIPILAEIPIFQSTKKITHTLPTWNIMFLNVLRKSIVDRSL